MFESIVLRRSEDGQLPTIGDIAEAMLFYRRVHLVLDYGSVHGLVSAIGAEQLLSLLQRKSVSAVYCRDQLGTNTQRIGALAHHSFIGFELVGRKEGDRYSTTDVIGRIFKETQKCSGRASLKLAEKFLERVPVKKLSGGDFFGDREKKLTEIATADLYDQPYLTEAISRALQYTPGFAGFTRALSIEVVPTQDGNFTVISNLDLSATNEARANRSQPLEPITEAHLLTEVFTARSDMIVAAHYGSDFKTSRIGSSLMELKHAALLRRSAIHADQMKSFQEVVVNEGRSLKEVLDTGEKSFSDFLRLLDKATLFKNWTGGIHPDASMVAEYLKEASREGWLQSLPGKTLRFAIGASIESLASGAETVFGVADSFLIDKISKGWRPNHFVDNRLKPFVNR